MTQWEFLDVYDKRLLRRLRKHQKLTEEEAKYIAHSDWVAMNVNGEPRLTLQALTLMPSYDLTELALMIGVVVELIQILAQAMKIVIIAAIIGVIRGIDRHV